ncbi:MAG: hypothetical protein WAU88_13860 [Candidatus Zixiibacteriota bacterium]
MAEKDRTTRIFYKLLVWSIGLSIVLTLGFLVFGDSLIRWAYDGGSIRGIVPARQVDSRTYDEYYHDSSLRFWSNVVVGLPLSILIIYLLYNLYRYLLSMSGKHSEEISSDQGPSVLLGSATAGLICLGLTLFSFWPTLATFGSAMIGPPEDNMACYWTLDWAQQNWLHSPHGLTYVNDLFYPEGSSFYFHAWSFYNLIGFCLLRLCMGAVSAYNVLILHTFVLSGVAGYLFTRYVSRNHWAALLGGVLFAFNPAHVIRAQHHMNIATIQFIPLFVLFFIRGVREGTRQNYIWAGLFLLLNALVDWNYLLYCLWFMLFVYLYLAIRKRRIWLKDIAIPSTVISGATMVLLSPWVIPMILESIRGSLGDGGGHNLFVVDLAALVIPGPMHLLLGGNNAITTINQTYSGFVWETAGYLGLAAVVIVIVTWRHLLTSASLLIIGMISFLLLALGSQPHLFGINIPALVPGRIVQMVPLMANSRALSRTMVFVYLFWSSLVAIGLTTLWHRWSKYRFRAAVIGVVAIVLVADYVGIAHDVTEVTVPPCYSALPRTEEKYGILDLPSGYHEVERYMMYQRSHSLPIVQGWVSRKSRPTLIDRLSMTDLAAQKRQLSEGRVKFIVFHKEFLPHTAISLPSYRMEYPTFFEDSTNLVLQVY